MPGVINMLTNVQTAEVSLVRRGANNKRFALTKSEDLDMNFNELLKSVLETEAEGETVLVATLKESGADEDAINVAVANFRLQSGFKDKLSKEEFSVVAKAAGFEVAKAKEEEDEEDPKKPGFLMSGKKMKTAKSHVPADMPVEMRKAFEEQDAALQQVKKEAAESAAQIVELQKAAERKEYIAKCETEYSHVPGMSAEKMGAMLMDAYAVSKEFGESIEKTWKETNEAVKKSALLVTAGSAQVHDGSSAMGKLEAVAKEFIAKDPTMDKDVAIAKAMEANPELYAEYLNENPAQRGR